MQVVATTLARTSAGKMRKFKMAALCYFTGNFSEKLIKQENIYIYPHCEFHENPLPQEKNISFLSQVA